MKDIAIYGAGGLGREIACLLKKINNRVSPTWNLIGFFDDGKTKGESIYHFGPALGGLNELNAWPTALSVILCFGNPSTLAKIATKITNPLIEFPNIIDPDFVVNDPDTFSIGKGNIITSGCGVTTNITIGNFNLLNGVISFGHDVSVGDYNCFMPRAIISGEVTIGNENLFGSNCFVKQQVQIGDNVTLSPLSVLLSKPKNGMLYIGNPAKIFKF